MPASTIVTVVLVTLMMGFIAAGAKKHPQAYQGEDGMRVLCSPRMGTVLFLICFLLGLFIAGLGVLCFLDIGFGQGGVVFAFFGLGLALSLFGLLAKWAWNKNRVCFDDQRVIRYRAVGKPVEIAWSEVASYSCNPQKTFLKTIDGRKIMVDYTYSGRDEFIEMIQWKLAGHTPAQ